MNGKVRKSCSGGIRSWVVLVVEVAPLGKVVDFR